MRTPVVLDRASPKPLQRQIYEAWRDGILGGRFRGGDRVPSTREMARTLGVARITVTAAHDQLTAEGYFEPVHGAGTFIAKEIPDQPLIRRTRSRPHAAPRALPLSAYARRLGERRPRPPVPAGVIDLAAAGPDLEHFPFPLWRRMLTRQLRGGPAVLQPPASAAGHQPLREEIARYVARSRAVQCDPDQVVIVNGSQQALDLCMRVLVDPGTTVAVEDPGYPGLRHLAAAHGARITPVGLDTEGLRVADLPADARLVCVTPSHQFPAGVSMSLRRRLDLLEWARAHGVLVIEDDYDSEYRYSGPPLPALQGLGDGASVLYLGTFSNVMFPALRIGYIIVPRPLLTPFTRAKAAADSYTAILEQAAITEFIADGHLERHIRRMRHLYKRRREALVAALARHFGADAEVRGDAAGMHALVRFRHGHILRGTEQRGVRVASADPYYLSGASPDECIISFCATGERTIAEGIRKLARAQPARRSS